MAEGTGQVWENECVPYCAASTSKIGYYPARITLSRVADTSAGPLFSRMTAVYRSVGPQGQTVEHFDVPLPPE